MYDVEMDEVTKDQRLASKSASFGLLYGSGPRGLMNYFATVGIFISLRQASEFHSMWHRAYPAFGKWHKECQARADDGAEMRTVIGRRRYLYGDDNKVTTQANNLVQGTGADISKAAMVEIHRRLPETARLLATVHDSYLIECDREDAPAVLSMVLAEMEDAAVPVLGDAVRLTGEGGYGPSWGEAK
jgi:DNA polymerase-1